ncbi:MAG: pilin [Patescibacteria group bacterium]
MKKILFAIGMLTILLSSSGLAASTLFDTSEFTRVQNLAKSETATEDELRSAAKLLEEDAFLAEDYARRDKAILEAVPFNDPNGLTYKEREDSYNGYIEAARLRRELATTLSNKADAAFNKEAVAALEAEAAACEKEVAELKAKGSLTEEETKAIKFCEERAAELRKQAAELKAPTPVNRNFKLIVPLPCLTLGVEKCATASETNPLKYIATLYNFGIGLGLLVAMAVIVFAGLRWATSAGNIAATADARDMIINAVLGVVMLLGATMILRIISPDLANLKLDALKPLANKNFDFGAHQKALDELYKIEKEQKARRKQIDTEIAELLKQVDAIKGTDIDSLIAKEALHLQIAKLQEEDAHLAYDNLTKIQGVYAADYNNASDESKAELKKTIDQAAQAARDAYNVWQNSKIPAVISRQASLAKLIAEKAAGRK